MSFLLDLIMGVAKAKGHVDSFIENNNERNKKVNSSKSIHQNSISNNSLNNEQSIGKLDINSRKKTASNRYNNILLEVEDLL